MKANVNFEWRNIEEPTWKKLGNHEKRLQDEWIHCWKPASSSRVFGK